MGAVFSGFHLLSPKQDLIDLLSSLNQKDETKKAGLPHIQIGGSPAISS
jgi:hypothetical protein